MFKIHALAIATIFAAVCTAIGPGAMAASDNSPVTRTPSPAEDGIPETFAAHRMSPEECAHLHNAHPGTPCGTLSEKTVTEYGVTMRAEDEHGVVLGSQTIISDHPIGDDDQAVEPDPVCRKSDAMCADGAGWKGWKASSGCRSAYAWIQEKSSMFRTVLYRYEHDMYYCFKKKRITSHSEDSKITKNDGQSYLRGTKYFRYFYNFANMGSRSGYASKGTGSIERCWVHYGCVGVHYPHVDLYAHADGTWYWSTQV
ncbi:hypothetical protein [Actinoallomurus iriomotensis]|uniref:Uncharacterized protein n=1 Tax=Actinoallomurus iriomotensis TaxID=478107 RepID=A0A9W6RLH9_9ACTN|nr:hypothetical protein [Actinoallomurus iriomotensis]GLY76227.1 hypothetical protein Airi01_044940 [Actinoallomurus iriomotensis]